MLIGIDGDHWYCSNGMCLGDPRAEFAFERTLRQAAASYRSQFGHQTPVPDELTPFLDMTPEEYNQHVEDNSQFGAGA